MCVCVCVCPGGGEDYVARTASVDGEPLLPRDDFRRCLKREVGEDVQTRGKAIGVCCFGKGRGLGLAKESVRRKHSLVVLTPRTDGREG